MAVPDTTTFTLQDVFTELGLPINGTNGLVQCFAAADPAQFDPAYEGSKNSLLNFRNYGAVPPGPPQNVTLTWGGLVDPSGACAMIDPETFWIPFGASFNSATKLYANSAGTVYASTGYYSNGSSYRYWDKDSASFTVTGLCM